MTGGRWLGAVVTYTVLGLILVIVLAPFGFVVLSSLKTNLDVLEVPPNLNIFDVAVIRKNYDAVLIQRNFLTYMKNSVVVVAGSTLLALVIGTPAAYGFSRFAFRGREDLAFWILSNRSCRWWRLRSQFI